MLSAAYESVWGCNQRHDRHDQLKWCWESGLDTETLYFEDFCWMRKLLWKCGRSEAGLEMRKASAQCGRVGKSAINLSVWMKEICTLLVKFPGCSYILFSPECKELTSMLDPQLYRWDVPPVIRCVHWTMQMWVLQTWIIAQGLAIVMSWHILRE